MTPPGRRGLGWSRWCCNHKPSLPMPGQLCPVRRPRRQWALDPPSREGEGGEYFLIGLGHDSHRRDQVIEPGDLDRRRGFGLGVGHTSLELVDEGLGVEYPTIGLVSPPRRECGGDVLRLVVDGDHVRSWVAEELDVV